MSEAFQDRVARVPMNTPASEHAYGAFQRGHAAARVACAMIAAEADAQLAALEAKLAEVERERDRWRRIRTPTHGPCCTCQGCGLDYDSCRCDLDEVADKLTTTEKERDEARRAILSFGANPAGFDWSVLGRLEQVEAALGESKVEIDRLLTALEAVRDLDGAFHGGHQFPADVKHPHEVAVQALAGHKSIMQKRWEWQGEAIAAAESRAEKAEAALAAIGEAAQAVIERWDSPKWNEAKPTSEVIGALRHQLTKGTVRG